MGRPIVLFKPTWLDRYFRKDFGALNDQGKEECTQILGDLMAALRDCKHPVQDPTLQKWRPSPYKGVVKIKSGHLAEYRCPGIMRVIACYFDDRQEILMVTVTLKHDHERMKRLLREHGGSLPSYLP